MLEKCGSFEDNIGVLNATLKCDTKLFMPPTSSPNLEPEMLFSWIKMKRFLVKFKPFH